MIKRKKMLAGLLTLAMTVNLCSTTVLAVTDAGTVVEGETDTNTKVESDDETVNANVEPTGEIAALSVEPDNETVDTLAAPADGVVDTTDELEEALQGAVLDGSNRVEYEGTSIDRNLTIPANVWVNANGQPLEIPTGVILTIESQAGLQATDITVNGSVDVLEDGHVTINLPGTQSGLGNIKHNWGLSFLSSVSSEQELKDAFSKAGDYTKYGQYDVTAEGNITLTEDFEIPENTAIDVRQNLIVSTGCTVTNNGRISVGSDATVDFKDNAIYTGNGRINVEKGNRETVEEAFKGVDFSSYIIDDYGDGWSIYKEQGGGDDGGNNDVIENFDDLKNALQGEGRYIEYVGESIPENLIIPPKFSVVAQDVEIAQGVEVIVSERATFEVSNISINGTVRIRPEGFMIVHVSDKSSGFENVIREGEWGLDFIVSASSEEELKNALSQSENYTSRGFYIIAVEGVDITLQEDVVIPVDTFFRVNEDANLTFTSGVRVTNWGQIFLGSGTVTFESDAEYIAYGSFEVTKVGRNELTEGVKGLDLDSYVVDEDDYSWYIHSDQVGDGTEIEDFEELKKALEGEPCGLIYIGGIIPEDLTIPMGFDVHIPDLQVPEGVTLTVESILSAENVRIEGAVKILDDAYMHINLSEYQVGLDKIEKVGESSTLAFHLPVGTENELKDVLAESKNYTSMGEFNIGLMDNIVLTDDIVIPEYVMLTVGTKLTVPSGKKMTNNGYVFVTGGILVFGDKNGYTGNGVFEVDRTLQDEVRNDPFEGVIGLDPADFEVGSSMYGGWILKLLTAYERVTEEVDAILDNIDDMSNEEILDAVQGLDSEKLEEALVADESGELADAIAKLEKKAGAGVDIEVTEKVPAIDESKVSMVGAGLNNPVDSSKDITLIIDKPEKPQVIDDKYDSKAAICFSMRMDNVEMAEGKLAVPVKITLPVPKTINPKAVVILHYDAKGGYEKIEPFVYEKNGQYFASFVVSHFSDFVMTTLADQAHKHTWDDGVTTKEPTVDAEGEKTYTCKGCGETKVESIPKLDDGKDDTDDGKDDTDDGKDDTDDGKDDTDDGKDDADDGKDDTDDGKNDADNDKDKTDKDEAGVPETGDDANLILWIGLFVMSVAGIIATVGKKRYKGRE